MTSLLYLLFTLNRVKLPLQEVTATYYMYVNNIKYYLSNKLILRHVKIPGQVDYELVAEYLIACAFCSSAV